MAKLMAVAVVLALAAGRAADEELDKAAAKAAEMGNYSCTVTTKMEGGRAAGGGGGDGGAPQPVEMQIKADAPVYLKSGDLEAYRKGEIVAVKQGEEWKRLERPERPAEGERPDRRVMAAQRLRGVRAPHEVLKDLKSSAFKEVKREDAEGGRIFSGDLTEEGIKPFTMRGRRGGGGGGGDRPAPKSTGTAKIWVNGDGVVTKYEVHVESTFKGRDEQDITTKFTSTVEIKDVGSTKYEVPEGAAKVFEAKRAEK
jgi:hypothetical protein